MTTTRMMLIAVAAAALLVATGCRKALETRACPTSAGAGTAVTCAVPGFDDRDYDLVVPPDYNGEPIPLIIALHGGGGNRQDAARTTCPQKDIDSPECLHAHAQRAGYAIVFPAGIGDKMIGTFRTWNAGGGQDGFRCTSGRACEEGFDDIAYIKTMLADVEERLAVDPSRIFATGISNGGAMSHRLACEMSDRIAAIAPIGGAMQLTVSDDCAPERPVPVLQIHGTADPCWLFEGGVPECGGGIIGQPGKRHVPVSRTMDEWAAINMCGDETMVDTLPDTVEDGTISFRETYQSCAADTVLIRIDGGGHTWPRGNQYLSAETIGPVPQDWGNELLIDWFDAHPMPD